jgi:carboxylesterase type B
MVDRWLREQTDRVMFTEDQQGALRRVRRNIGRFGSDPDNVTIAGRSASGLSGLAQLVSPRSRGLFQRAMARSGAFASTQQALGASEAAGEELAAKTGCPDRSAAISGEYPLGADAPPDMAFSRLVSDANFACPALQVDRWASGHAPTFAYEFDDQRIPDANQGVADRDCHSRVSVTPRI